MRMRPRGAEWGGYKGEPRRRVVWRTSVLSPPRHAPPPPPHTHPTHTYTPTHTQPPDPPARSLPLWPYCIFLGAHYGNYNGMFAICIAVTVLCMFGLGCGARTDGRGHPGLRRRRRRQVAGRVRRARRARNSPSRRRDPPLPGSVLQAKIIRQSWLKQGVSDVRSPAPVTRLSKQHWRPPPSPVGPPTSFHPRRSAQVLMVINGGLAAAASYLVGWGLQNAVGRGGCV